jgi:uncharacterized protein involved in exopolysaccharide biosynthesis
VAAVITAPTDSQQTLERLRSLWRLRSTFWWVASAALLVSMLLALLLPPVFKSQATILIEQQELPQDLVRSSITSFADERIQVISQRVMTGQNLMKIIDQYQLYPERRHREPREVLLKRMRSDIEMKTITADVIDPRNGHPTQATIAFSVAYQSHSPDLALKVASELTSLYLNENLTRRTQVAKENAEFLAEEADRQQKHVDDIDAQLAAFKEKHHDRLPELATLNVELMNRTELDLREAQNRVQAFDQQRVLLEAQLAQINPTSLIYSQKGDRVYTPEDRLRSLRSELATLSATYGPEHPDVLRAQREIAGLEKEVKTLSAATDLFRDLESARAALAAARERYSPDHPDIVRLTAKVAALEKAIEEQPAATSVSRADAHADNPAYIQVKGQIDAVEIEREAALKRQGELQAKLDDYERRFAQAPEVERGYRELARSLESAQAKLQELRAKMTEAQVSQHLETEQKGERFTLIEPAQPPEKPVTPNRPLILILGAFLSLALGVGAVLGRDRLDGSVRGSLDLKRLLDVAPLASIPVLVTDRELRARRRRRLIQAAAGAAAVVLLLAIVHLAVRPVDVLWFVLVRRFVG